MSGNSRHRLGAVAIKYNVGADTIVSLLKEEGFNNVSSNLSYVLNDEQYAFVHNQFAENLLIKQQVVASRNEEIIDKIVNVLPRLIDLLNLNKELKNLSYHRFPWKQKEVTKLVKDYLDNFPKDILGKIKVQNLISIEVFAEIDTLLNEEVKVKKSNSPQVGENIYFTEERETYDDGPYCGACQQAPCMCSDPEQSSMTYWF